MHRDRDKAVWQVSCRTLLLERVSDRMSRNVPLDCLDAKILGAEAPPMWKTLGTVDPVFQKYYDAMSPERRMQYVRMNLAAWIVFKRPMRPKLNNPEAAAKEGQQEAQKETTHTRR